MLTPPVFIIEKDSCMIYDDDSVKAFEVLILFMISNRKAKSTDVFSSTHWKTRDFIALSLYYFCRIFCFSVYDVLNAIRSKMNTEVFYQVLNLVEGYAKEYNHPARELKRIPKFKSIVPFWMLYARLDHKDLVAVISV